MPASPQGCSRRCPCGDCRRRGAEQDNLLGMKLLRDLTSIFSNRGAWNQFAVLPAVFSQAESFVECHAVTLAESKRSFNGNTSWVSDDCMRCFGHLPD